MSTRFFISDLHYHHKNILTFSREDGSPLRPFNNLDEMQATISHNWNKVVGHNDRVYVLGDVTLKSSAWALDFLGQLKGKKILIKGNHDQCKLSAYVKYFEDVRACDVKPGMVLTHVPIHPSSLNRWGVNVHGHLHANIVRLENGNPDPRYMNVCVEHTNYTPISQDELQLRLGK